MYLINTEEVKEPDNYSDFRTLQEWGLQTQCKLRFPSPSFAPDTTAFIADGAGFVSCLVLPESAATSNQGAISFSIPDTWNRGTMTCSVSYSSATSGGTYAVQCLWYTAKAGDTINSGSTSAQDTLPAISGAWVLGTHTFTAQRVAHPTATFATTRIPRLCSVGADTSTGDLCILEATITYEPSRY